MTAKAKLELTKRFYEALFAGDWSFIEANVTSDFEVTESPALPYAGSWKGVEEFQRLFGAMVNEYFENLDFRLVSLAADDEHALAYFVLKGIGRRTRREFQVEVAEVTTFLDGKVKSLKPFYFDPNVVAEAIGR